VEPQALVRVLAEDDYHSYCRAWRNDREYSSMCYADAVAEKLIDGVWIPVCSQHLWYLGE
jgi:hypothetical protein